MPKKRGIGGWLVLPAIGIILNPILLLFNLVNRFSFLSTAEHKLVADKYPTVGTLTGLEIFGNVIFLIIALVLLFQFFGKRASAPTTFIWFVSLKLGLSILLFLISTSLWSIAPQLVVDYLVPAFGYGVGAAIWIPYFRRSERVQNTFVH